MKTDLKEKWVAALRSDKYKQGDGHLRFIDHENVTTFCCLGVLCDVMGAEWIDGRPMLGDIHLKRINVDDADGSTYDEEEYLSFGTLSSIDLLAADQEELASMNDGGKSFAIIADHIEKTL